MAHKNPHLSMADLIDILAEMGLQKMDPTRKRSKAVDEITIEDETKKSIEANPEAGKSPAPAKKHLSKDAKRDKKGKRYGHPAYSQESHPDERLDVPWFIRGESYDFAAKGKHISVSARREIWKKAEGRCENCGSTWALQVDHRNPVAKGGSNRLRNLRLLCRPCNQRAAIEAFGLRKMQSYLGDRHSN